jgi:hypothetical protein
MFSRDSGDKGVRGGRPIIATERPADFRAIGHTSQDLKPVSPRHFPLPRIFFALLAFAHRAFAAFVASFFLSSGLSAAMRFLPPLPPAAFPPFLPISRITSEITFRRIVLFYEEGPNNRQFALLTPRPRFERVYATSANGIDALVATGRAVLLTPTRP